MNVSQLRSWILSGAGSTRVSLPDLDPALVFDDGIRRITKDAIETVVGQAPFTSVRIITELVVESSACIVAEGTDPVTGMRHRQAWVFEFRSGKLVQILLTSAHIPDEPHDGSFQLPSDSEQRR